MTKKEAKKILRAAKRTVESILDEIESEIDNINNEHIDEGWDIDTTVALSEDLQQKLNELLKANW